MCEFKKDVKLSIKDISRYLVMFRVGIVLIDGFSLMAYASAMEPLRAANLFSNEPLYSVRNLPVSGANSRSSSGALIKADAYLGEQVDFDLLLIVAGKEAGCYRNAQLENWLRLLASRGVLIGGVSGGPLVLAHSGVMDGYRMTIHWDHVDALTQISPRLVVERSLYTLDRNRLTCGGGTAALDMMLALIKYQQGPEIALRVSDWFLHTDMREGENAQRSGLAERYNTSNEHLLKALEAMENHIADPLELQQLAALAGLGARQLNRLFTKYLQSSAVNFYRHLRLKKSQQLLNRTSLSIHDVALATGFANGGHLSKSFSDLFGLPPKRYRELSRAENSVSDLDGPDMS
ncbi:MAG: transcriptional regulator GlxA family with amidase domain [Granulosicoccus sp.]